MSEQMSAQQYLREGERIDDLQRDELRIIQNPKLFCFGMDAVLLADFAMAHASEKALDLCTGTGIIPTLMSAKTKCRCFTGLELHPQTAQMAQRSVLLNGLQDILQIRQGNIRCIGELVGRGSFDVVTCNPPYMSVGHGLTRESAGMAKRFRKKGENPGDDILAEPEEPAVSDPAAPAFKEEGEAETPDALTMARHEVCASLEDVVRACAYALREQGRLYLVHRPARLAEIICMLRDYRLEPKRMRLVYPMADREPNMLLLEARKGGGSGMVVEAPLIVYREAGVYTDEIRKIYED